MERSVLNIIWPEAEIESTDMLLSGRRHNITRSVDGVSVKETVLEVNMPSNPGMVKELMAKGVSEENLRDMFSKSRSDLEWELTMFKSVRHKNLAPVEEFVIRDNVTLPGWKCFIRGGKYAPLPEKLESEKDIIRLGSELCSAVMELNRVDMLHGDIRPENIGTDAEGNYVLSGFGVRRCTETIDNRTSEGGFDAPEVRKKGKYSVASEIYSIGKTLEALCGENVSEELCEIIAKATVEDVAGRFSSASDMLAELTELGTPESQLKRARREQENREAKKAKNIEEARKALEVQRAKEAEEARKAEEERIAAEARREEEERLAEAARIAEEKRQKEMRLEAEAAAAAILAEEIKKAEEKRKAEEEERLAEEARLAEEEKIAAEAEPEKAEEIEEPAEKIAEETEKTVEEAEDIAEEQVEEVSEKEPAEDALEETEELNETEEFNETEEPVDETAEENTEETAEEASEEASEEREEPDEEPAEETAGESAEEAAEEAEEAAEEETVVEEENAEAVEAEAVPEIEEKAEEIPEVQETETKKRRIWPWIVLIAVIAVAAALAVLKPWETSNAEPENDPPKVEDEQTENPAEPEQTPEKAPEEEPKEDPVQTPENEPVTDVYDEPDITEDKEETPEEIPEEVPEEPADEPADEPAQSENPYAENEFDLNTSTEKLTMDKLEGMNRYESFMVINSFYARHGKIFKTASIQKYFEDQSWYTPVTKDSKEIVSEFNDIEVENLRTVVKYQVSKGYRKAK